MKQTIIYWLEQICAALKSANATQVQSDWTQADNTKLDYIKNKPTILSATIIEGTVADSAFAPSSGQPSMSDAVALISAGNIVYLKYTSSGDTIMEMALSCNATDGVISTTNLTWTGA